MCADCESDGFRLRAVTLIDFENLPPEMKQTILLLVNNAADRDAAQKALSDIMKQIEFDITAAELAAYLFKPGHASRSVW
ncbi:hypothetical protein CCF81_20095 [Salmonella enterica]|nr:hypothetical protein [Salmonella enterica]